MWACTCIVTTWGESQLGFRVLSDWPLRDANRLLWIALCRPPVKTILIEHSLSKHTDCQWILNWAPCHSDWWGKFKLKPDSDSDSRSGCLWQGLRGTGNLPRIVHYVRISGYDLLIYRYSIWHCTRCRNTTSLYSGICEHVFHWYRLFFYDIGFDIGWQERWIWASSYRVSILCMLS